MVVGKWRNTPSKKSPAISHKFARYLSTKMQSGSTTAEEQHSVVLKGGRVAP